MPQTTLTATAVEKLNRLAKRHRDETGKTLSAALDFVAQQAGYGNWKKVTELRALHAPTLLPANHIWRSYWYHDSTTPRQHQCSSVEELCERLGGVEPVLMRSHCSHSLPGARCLCELDPFMTAKRANVRLAIGDKYDFYNFMYLREEPFRELGLWDVRITMRGETYIHEEQLFATSSNDDRSNSLNPNNHAFKASLDNRSRQLNPEDAQFDIGRVPPKLATDSGSVLTSSYQVQDPDEDLDGGDVYWYDGIDD